MVVYAAFRRFLLNIYETMGFTYYFRNFLKINFKFEFLFLL